MEGNSYQEVFTNEINSFAEKLIELNGKLKIKLIQRDLHKGRPYLQKRYDQLNTEVLELIEEIESLFSHTPTTELNF
jgi:hypothetical protein